MKHFFLVSAFFFIITNTELNAQHQMTSARRAYVNRAQSFHDLFKVSSFVKLELTSESLVGVIHKALKIGDHWFVHDSSAGHVLQFSEDGSYVRIVGGVGQGPTEYLLPIGIHQVFDHQLLIHDGRAGEIILYDSNGDFRSRYHFRTDFPGIHPHAFVWDEPERLFLGWSSSMTGKSAPEHAIMAYEQGRLKHLTSWSTTNQRILDRKKNHSIGVYNDGGFAVIDGQIWAGSPYEAHMVIYDQNGKQKKIIHRKHAQQITLDQVLDLDFTQLNDVRTLRQSVRNEHIFPIGDLVLAPIRENGKRYMDIYDRQGELLNSTVTFAPIVMPLATQEDRMITYLPTLLNVQQHKDLLGTQGFELLTSAGFDPDSYEDQNNFLMIFTLVR